MAKYDTLHNFFDETLKVNWDMETVDRSIDHNKVKKLLELIPNHDNKKFIMDIINNTTYISFNQFKTALINSFNQFKDDINSTHANTNEFIILNMIFRQPHHHIAYVKSNDWCIVLLWTHLKNLNINKFMHPETKLTPNHYNLIIIDDASYSGTQLDKFLEKVLRNSIGHYYEQINKHNLYYDICSGESKLTETDINAIGYKFNIYIIIPFLTSGLIEKLKQKYPTKIMKRLHEVIDINYYNEKGFELIEDGKTNVHLFHNLGISDHIRPTFYFDHKIGDFYSTYFNIYAQGNPYPPYPIEKSGIGTLLKEPFSKYKIFELNTLFQKFLVSQPTNI